jgi:hypothetical protein
MISSPRGPRKSEERGEREGEREREKEREREREREREIERERERERNEWKVGVQFVRVTPTASHQAHQQCNVAAACPASMLAEPQFARRKS